MIMIVIMITHVIPFFMMVIIVIYKFYFLLNFWFQAGFFR